MCQAVWQAQDPKEEEDGELLLPLRLHMAAGPAEGRQLTLLTSFATWSYLQESLLSLRPINGELSH